jgi:GTPase SAR1 family protein
MNENPYEFISYKKMIIFGAEGTGKSSLTKRLERGSFTNEYHTENSIL